MARLPDLVRDLKLETHFLPDSSVETVHTYLESDPTSQQRLVSRLEHWQRQKKIGGGGFGSVWLEKCTKGGHRDIKVRAIKQIEIDRREITHQILDGLCLMHDNEFAHRDLKPNNILLKGCPPNGWWVKIADFGISKRIEDEHGNSTTLKGTLGYIAPELHRFTEQGTPYAADIWAVREIAFRMLTKQPTFKDLGLLFNYVIIQRKTEEH